MRQRLPGLGGMALTRSILSSTCAILCGLISGPVLAQGDAEAGRLKADTCMGCHGIPGYTNVYPTYHVPKLGGQHAEYIVAALQTYKTGQRDHSTMHAQAVALSEQDMADIAAYFESLGASADAAPMPAAAGKGQQQAAKANKGQ